MSKLAPAVKDQILLFPADEQPVFFPCLISKKTPKMTKAYPAIYQDRLSLLGAAYSRPSWS